MHLLNCNEREVKEAMKRAKPDDVIAVCDTRDRVARTWVTSLGNMSEQDIQEWEARCALGRVIPTVIIAVPKQAAIDITADHAPHISEVLEFLSGTGHQVVLTIAANGTRMAAFPRG